MSIAGLAEQIKRAADPGTEPPPNADAWPEPDLTVLQQRREAPKFPLEIFGKLWTQWIKDAAAASACPADYVAAPLLAAGSATIGHARWARATESWIEPPHLWCASVGDSGDGKSPGADAIYRHVTPEIERRMASEFPDKLREAQAAIEVAKAKHEAWKQDVRQAVKDGKTPPSSPPLVPEEPIKPRLVMDDVTHEKVALVLSAVPKGVLMRRDEIAGFLLGMNDYSEAARAFWIEAYGGRQKSVDRVKHPVPINVPRLAVSWHGGIQPERLAQVMREADDGLLARFMWFWPEPVPFSIANKPPAIDLAVTWFDRLRMLELGASDNGPYPLTVPLTRAAVARLEKFGRALQGQKEFAAGLMRSAIGKGRGLILRVSLVLEFLWWSAKDGYEAPPQEISENAVLAAAKFVFEYVMPMAERTYGDAACPEPERNAATLARWIAKTLLKEPSDLKSSESLKEVHVRRLQREIRLPGLRLAEEIHAACEALVEAGWLWRAPGRGGKQRGREAYPVSPRLKGALMRAAQ
jgi:hypothetical protein